MAGVCVRGLPRLLVLLMLPCFTLASSPAQYATLREASFRNTTLAAGRPTSSLSSRSISTTSTTTDSDVSSASTHSMGDFIAFGMGMSTSSGLSSETSSEVNVLSHISTNTTSDRETSLSHASYDPVSSLSSGRRSDSPTAMVHTNGSRTHAPTVLTETASVGTILGPKPTNATIIKTGFIPDNPNAIPPDPPISYNQSFTFSGDCWNQWSQFWSASELVTRVGYYSHGLTTTYTTTESSRWKSTSTVLSSFETTVSNGQFPVTIYSTLAPVTDFEWFGTPTTTWTTTETTWDNTRQSIMPNASLQQPACVLPTVVPQCQSSWDEYVATKMRVSTDLPFPISGPPGCNAFATTTIPLSCQAPLSTWSSVRSSYFANLGAPICSQAKVADDYCSSTRAQFIHKMEGKAGQSDGVPEIDQTATTINGVSTDIAYWPSETTIGGPGCTLGCGSCAMQGGTVELIYWPTATANATGSVSTVGPMTVETLGTTFTSPTVSFSHKSGRCVSLTPFIVGLCVLRRTVGTEQLQQVWTHNIEHHRSHYKY